MQTTLKIFIVLFNENQLPTHKEFLLVSEQNTRKLLF